jgi:outer membrane protein OmpA-like peptidoglycan-associated protein
VRKLMATLPESKHFRVEGHTDNRGGAALNRNLSKQRAASVVTWLVKHGVAKDRLVAQGFGPDRPIDTNDTEEGRKNNRRVEFHIVDGDAAAAPEKPAQPAKPAKPAAPKAPAPKKK